MCSCWSAKPQSPVQEASLALLALLDETCRANGLSYTLFGDTLAGNVHYGSFLPSQPYIDVALLYPDYIALIELLRKKTEGSRDYYLLDADNCAQYEALHTRLMKRSRVRLPKGRAADEAYYDYYLTIHPIFFAGDTNAAFRNLSRRCNRFKRVLDARLYSWDLIRVKYWARALCQYVYRSMRKPDTYERLLDCATQYTCNTRYVYITFLAGRRGVSVLADTYRDIEDATFCGVRCMAIRQAKQWVSEAYSPTALNALLSASEMPLRSMGPEALRSLQLVQLELLRQIDGVCKAAGICYSIAFGTVLGAIRHGGFIPWDDDADVLMPYEDYLRFIEVARRTLDSELYSIRTLEMDRNCNLSYAQIQRKGTSLVRREYERYDTQKGIFVDIFPLFNGTKNPFFHVIQALTCRYYRVALWAHMGASRERSPIWRAIYTRMARRGNKHAYAKFLRWATIIKKNHGKLLYLGGTPSRIPYCAHYIRKSAYENMGTISFEEYNFSLAHHAHETMRYFYSSEYMRFPPLDSRFTVRLDGALDLGGLYGYRAAENSY